MRFALITEGASEHRVIKHLIAKYFKDFEPEINQIQPKVVNNKQAVIGGWNEVLKYCEREELKDVFVENNFLIIQIDTDQSQNRAFNVNHIDSTGKLKSDETLYNDVLHKLQMRIKPEIFEQYKERILFAICIHSIECWLLPICYNDNHRLSTNNCIKTLNSALSKQNKLTISPSGKNKSNGIKAYTQILSDLKRKSDIINSSKFNFGFKSFVESLEKLDGNT